MRMDSPLPIQDPSYWWQIQLEEATSTGESSSRDLLQNTSVEHKGWNPSLRTIPTQEEWEHWLELRIEEAFQEW